MLTKSFFFFFFAGKYQEGQTCDPKTWKANFRCAMNSLPDVEEVKDKSINKGHQAMRVFRLLPTTPKSRGEITGRRRAELTLLLIFWFFSSVLGLFCKHKKLFKMLTRCLFLSSAQTNGPKRSKARQ